MKNFKVIISLVALIAVGAASAVLPRRGSKPTEETTKKTPLTKSTQPAKKPTVSTRRVAGQTTTQKDIFGEGYKAPEQIPAPIGTGWDRSVTEVADIFYDTNSKQLKKEGIEQYVDIVRDELINTKQKVNNVILIKTTYDNAATILQSVRNEKKLNKQLSDQLMQMINNTVMPLEITEGYRPLPTPKVSQAPQSKKLPAIPTEEIFQMKDVSSASDIALKALIQDNPNITINDLSAITAKKYMNAFINNNGEFQSAWFDFAIPIFKKANYSNSDILHMLPENARVIYNFYKDKDPKDFLDQTTAELIKKQTESALERSKENEKKSQQILPLEKPVQEALQLLKEEIEKHNQLQYTFLPSVTPKHINAFIFNNTFQPAWFDFAVTLLKEGGFSEGNSLSEKILAYAQTIFNHYAKKDAKAALDDISKQLITNEIRAAIQRSKENEKKK